MLKVFITMGITINDKAILNGITALYIIPLITNDPACGGIFILFYNFKNFINFYEFFVLCIHRYVPAKNDQERAKWVTMPIFPYY